MKKVILTTNSEFGQANVFLAAGHALQAVDPDVEIHFVSFGNISKFVTAASQYSVQCTPNARPWTFHALDGPSHFEAIISEDGGTLVWEKMIRPPSFASTMDLLSVLSIIILPWNGSQFTQVYKSFVQIVEQVRPDIIAIDSLFSPALSACKHLKFKHIILSPNTLKDFAAASQPWGAVLWKFPVMGSAFPFPVPWRSIPANIIYCLTQAWYLLMDGRSRTVAAQIKRDVGADLITFSNLMMQPPKDTKILVANRAEIDFPLAVIPEHLTPCGPIMRAVPPVSDIDPELDAWLRRGPTVFISLGTHKPMLEDEALEMTGAIRQLLKVADARKADEIGGVAGKLQVMWKLKKGDGPDYGVVPGSKIHGLLGDWMDADRVRIVDWVKPEPSAVLQTGNVVCSVNHGGANSFNDGLTCGIPQVNLPPWLDCYDFGCRVEVLGIGRWGNKKAMPKCSAVELGPILVDVVLGPEAPSMRAKARELAALCAKTPGASVAASVILEEIDGKKNK